MILYNNRDIVRGILLATSGSVVFSSQVLLPSLLSTILCAITLALPEAREFFVISDSMARIYATIIGFVIVMRTTLAFGRFFEGIENVTHMFSKWRDGYATLLVFYEASIAQHQQKGDIKAVETLLESKARILHWFSLLAALAVQRVQADESYVDDNWENADGSTDFPQLNIKAHAKSTQQEVEAQTSFLGSLTAPRASCSAEVTEQASHRHATAVGAASPECSEETTATPATDAASGGHQQPTSAARKMRKLSIAGNSSSSLSLDLAPVEQSRVRWTQQSSAGMSSQGFFTQTPSHVNWRLRASMHSSAMRSRSTTIGDVANASRPDTRVQVVGPLSPEEKWMIQHASDKAPVVLKWILFEISHLSVTKHLLIAPPILARVYQELSSGMLGYNLSCKIADVPFPFPFAQFLQYALYAFFIFCPFLVLENIGEWQLEITWLCLPINFLACAGFAALNEISIELEEPFGTDANDYPIHILQWTLVQVLQDLFFQVLPEDFDLTCFGDDYPTLDQEVKKSCELFEMRRSTTKPPRSSEGGAPTPAAKALATKFDELKTTVIAATRLMQRQRSNGHADAADQVHLGKLMGVLEQATDFEKVSGTGASAGTVHGDPKGAVVNRHAAFYDAFADAFHLGSSVHVSTPTPPQHCSDGVPKEQEQLTGEELAAAVKEIIDSSSNQALREELSALVRQHMAASRILEMAQARQPGL